MPRRRVEREERHKSFLLIELIHGRPGRGGRARLVCWTPCFEPVAEWRGSVIELGTADRQRLVALVGRIGDAHGRARAAAAKQRAIYSTGGPTPAQAVRAGFLLDQAAKIIQRSMRQEAE